VARSIGFAPDTVTFQSELYCFCFEDSSVMNAAIPEGQGLYDPANEHDACGVGFVAHIRGKKSHSIIEQGLLILKNLDHRGAVGADPLMGDGAGILIQIPDGFFREEMARQGISLPQPGDYGVGMVFLPKESASRLACQEEIERAVRSEHQVVLGWRDVPIDHACRCRRRCVPGNR
jgi:glutamate synthase (NADPH/NADH) large chain